MMLAARQALAQQQHAPCSSSCCFRTALRSIAVGNRQETSLFTFAAPITAKSSTLSAAAQSQKSGPPRASMGIPTSYCIQLKRCRGFAVPLEPSNRCVVDIVVSAASSHRTRPHRPPNLSLNIDTTNRPQFRPFSQPSQPHPRCHFSVV